MPPLRPEIATGAQQPQTFPSGDLIGLTLPELRRKLGGGLLAGEVHPGLVMENGAEPPLSFLTLADVLADPWAQQRAEIGYRGDPPSGEWTSCLANFGPVISLSSGSALNSLFVFRGELLSEIRRAHTYPNAPLERPVRPGETKPADPVRHPFLPGVGQLPLADGVAFLTRWYAPRVTANDQITTRCAMERPKPGAPARSFNVPRASPPPFSLAAPSAASEAPLRLGQPIAGGAAAFAKADKRAVLIPGADGYGVMVFDTGLPDGLAFAGVRNDRVVWLAREAGPAAGAGFWPGHLCVGADGVPGKARKGCSADGQFTPVH